MNSLQQKLADAGLPKKHARRSFLPNGSKVRFKTRDGVEGMLVIDGLSKLFWSFSLRNIPKTRRIGFACSSDGCTKVYSYGVRRTVVGPKLLEAGIFKFCYECKDKRSVVSVHLEDVVEVLHCP